MNPLPSVRRPIAPAAAAGMLGTLLCGCFAPAEPPPGRDLVEAGSVVEASPVAEPTDEPTEERAFDQPLRPVSEAIDASIAPLKAARSPDWKPKPGSGGYDPLEGLRRSFEQLLGGFDFDVELVPVHTDRRFFLRFEPTPENVAAVRERYRLRTTEWPTDRPGADEPAKPVDPLEGEDPFDEARGQFFAVYPDRWPPLRPGDVTWHNSDLHAFTMSVTRVRLLAVDKNRGEAVFYSESLDAGP